MYKESEQYVTRVQEYILAHNLIAENNTLIIGLSGGPDSVFLLHVLAHLRSFFKLNLIAAHLDHGWRDNSADDVEFCKRIAAHYDVEFISAHAHDSKHQHKYNGSREDMGRMLRRTFFENLAERYQAHAIALGHHADDNNETFFLRLIRGSGISGLACMRPRDGIYIRPLLCMRKHEILEFLHKHNQEYLTDSTNNSTVFLRNSIRKNALPVLETIDPRFAANLNRTINNLAQTDLFLEQLTQKTYGSLVADGACPHSLDTNSSRYSLGMSGETARGECPTKPDISSHSASLVFDQFMHLDPYMQKRILELFFINNKAHFVPSENFYKEIFKFLNSSATRHELHTTWALVKKNNKLSIEHINGEKHMDYVHNKNATTCLEHE